MSPKSMWVPFSMLYGVVILFFCANHVLGGHPINMTFAVLFSAWLAGCLWVDDQVEHWDRPDRKAERAARWAAMHG